ncbi:uncharacterized protein LOC142018790 [Carettochelys insculpta]|uniref:uncharacterized protein LOC142018790 n=1 Tax=Carettochelys insculpta TaxID=44489 RepID=UPI003EB90EF9
MRWQTFLELRLWLSPALKHQAARLQCAFPVEKGVAIAVWKLATPDSYRSMGHQFGVGKATVGTAVMERVIRIRDVDSAITDFTTVGFLNCLGALNGTHLRPGVQRRTVHKLEGLPFCGPAGCCGQQEPVPGHIRGVAQLHPCHVGLPELRPMLLLEAGLYIPQREIPLADTTLPLCLVTNAAYPLQYWLMQPSMGHPTLSQECFNGQLNQARHVVEHTFGCLKGRWCCLLAQLDVNVFSVLQVTGTCCMLHNIMESKGEVFMQGWVPDIGTLAARLTRMGSASRRLCAGTLTRGSSEHSPGRPQWASLTLLPTSCTLPTTEHTAHRVFKKINWCVGIEGIDMLKGEREDETWTKKQKKPVVLMIEEHIYNLTIFRAKFWNLYNPSGVTGSLSSRTEVKE